MWPFAKDLFYRGWQQALANGSSTGISVFWLGFGVLALGFIFTVGIEWLTAGRNMAALTSAVKSWKSWVGAALALFVGWVCLLAYSTLSVTYQDHQRLVAAAEKSPPPKTQEEPTANPPKSNSQNPQKSPKIETHIKQNGNGNTANPGIIAAPINQGPCGVVQSGGSNNTASPNCGPPPLVLTVASIESGHSQNSLFTDKPGYIKTEITIVPNQAVLAPFTVFLDFDNPISEIGHTVKNVAAQMSGGSYRIGIHAKETVLTNIGPQHPLVVVVFSTLPVTLTGPPHVEH